jgi:hypothetical protein
LIDSTESAHALLLLGRHYVVVRIAVDQLDQRVDACLTGHLVHGDGELLMLLLELVFLQIEQFAVTVANADIDEIVRRDQMFLSFPSERYFLASTAMRTWYLPLGNGESVAETAGTRQPLKP